MDQRPILIRIFVSPFKMNQLKPIIEKMKKVLFILFLISIPMVTLAKGDDPFKGKIAYSVTYEGEGAEILQMLSFTEFAYYFGDQQLRIHFGGGMGDLMGDFVTNTKKQETFMIDDSQQVAYTIESAEEEGPKNVIIEKQKEKEKILGYKCTKYLVTVTTDSSVMVSEYWTTTDIVIPKSKKTTDMGNSIFVEGLEGFPLKIVVNLEGISMIQTATEVSRYEPEADLFEIPKNYEVKDISESPLMNPGGAEE